VKLLPEMTRIDESSWPGLIIIFVGVQGKARTQRSDDVDV
jgi:hypothetical protein